jgi:hypothetical protein
MIPNPLADALFRGCELVHGRPLLPSGQDSWVLLHYFDADFAGPLD